MKRFYYSDSIDHFCKSATDSIIAKLVMGNQFALEQTQRDAWLQQIHILQPILGTLQGSIYFEYSIPRMGRRIDVVLLIKQVIFVLEFKVGEKEFTASAEEQVMDYALDLKNFHEESHQKYIAPMLIATQAKSIMPVISPTPHNDKLFFPIKSNQESILRIIKDVLAFSSGGDIDSTKWERGRYYPTPTIIEAAMALYSGHAVEEISRNDAAAINLTKTSKAIAKIINDSKTYSKKSICFVTGVPGAGKTLVGLDVATKHIDIKSELYSVFLSGNGPLVAILREALARNRVYREKKKGKKKKLGDARREVKMFIQNVHNFRDEGIVEAVKPPIEHVTLFDEAQRAWNMQQTTNFMSRKKKISGFNQSEPEFLISCMNRHQDWAVIICLVGGGQEINTGEAGIGEWIESVSRSFKDWSVYLSPNLLDSEYGLDNLSTPIKNLKSINYDEDLHLAVSMRSFRAENVSILIKHLLDNNKSEAKKNLQDLNDRYPIKITRDLNKAKQWLKSKARGSERYGMVVSSAADRLKPHAIDVKSPVDPIHWFLDGKDDVRSSYYLEDVATEFHVQGLELDWSCVIWDADFRYSDKGWEHWSFCGDRWNHINKEERKKYQKNAYRVLLTRARQGMIIVVPEGDVSDPTRSSKFYDSTYSYLMEIGFEEIV